MLEMDISSEWALEDNNNGQREAIGPPASLSHDEPEGNNGVKPEELEEPSLPRTSAEEADRAAHRAAATAAAAWA